MYRIQQVEIKILTNTFRVDQTHNATGDQPLFVDTRLTDVGEHLFASNNGIMTTMLNGTADAIIASKQSAWKIARLPFIVFITLGAIHVITLNLADLILKCCDNEMGSFLYPFISPIFDAAESIIEQLLSEQIEKQVKEFSGITNWVRAGTPVKMNK